MEPRITWGELLLVLLAFGGPAYALGAAFQQARLRRAGRVSLFRRFCALAGGWALAVVLTVVGMYATTALPAAAWRYQGRISTWAMYAILVTLPALVAAAIAFPLAGFAARPRPPAP